MARTIPIAGVQRPAWTPEGLELLRQEYDYWEAVFARRAERARPKPGEPSHPTVQAAVRHHLSCVAAVRTMRQRRKG